MTDAFTPCWQEGTRSRVGGVTSSFRINPFRDRPQQALFMRSLELLQEATRQMKTETKSL